MINRRIRHHRHAVLRLAARPARVAGGLIVTRKRYAAFLYGIFRAQGLCARRAFNKARVAAAKLVDF